MKKFISLLSVFLMLSMVGCGSSQNGSKSGGESEGEIAFWVYEPQSMDDKTKLDDLVKVFEDENDVNVKITYIPKDNFNTKLNAAIAVQKGPDVSYLDQPLIAKFEEDELLFDITDLLNNSEKASVEDYFSGAFDTNKVDGKVYGLPLSMTTVALYYNKDLVANPPKNWDEWVSISKDVYVKDQIAAFEGIGGGGWGAWLLPAFIHSAGGSMVNEDETAVTFGEQPGIDSLNLLVNLLKYSDQSVRESQNAFGNGLVAFKVSGPWEIDSFKTNFPNLNFGVTLIPAKDSFTSYSNIGGDNLVVYKDSTNAESGYELIEFLTNEKNSETMAEITGNFPININAAKADKYTSDEYLSVFMKQMETAVARPRLTDWLKVNDEVIGTALDEVFVGQEDPAKALKTANEKASQILFEK
ncbi:MAG: extracellular solute-binding protein [Clostridiaceae bacterium]